MSRSDSSLEQASFDELASEIAARMAQAVDTHASENIPDDALGQVFGSTIRIFAAKSQNHKTPRPFARNSGISITDVAIGCTAMMDSVGLSAFELGAWQSMSGIGKLDQTAD